MKPSKDVATIMALRKQRTDADQKIEQLRRKVLEIYVMGYRDGTLTEAEILDEIPLLAIGSAEQERVMEELIALADERGVNLKQIKEKMARRYYRYGLNERLSVPEKFLNQAAKWFGDVQDNEAEVRCDKAVKYFYGLSDRVDEMIKKEKPEYFDYRDDSDDEQSRGASA